MVFVKVVHCREVRRFSLESTAVSFGEFRARIARLFEEEAAEKVLLRYQDKDGDFVSVSSDEELQEAFRQLGEKEDDTIRFCMNVKGDDAGSFWGSSGPPHRWGMGRHGFGRGNHGCPLLNCPAMRDKDGHSCPLLCCPAMYGRGGGFGGHHSCPVFNKSRRSSCPFLACCGSSKKGCPMFSGRSGCPMFSGHGGYPMFSGRSGCPMFSGHGGCPMFSGRSGCPMFSGRSGCPMFSGRSGCPMFSGDGQSHGQHGDCSFLASHPMFHSQEPASEGEGDHHGCPFFACPSMKTAHEQFYHPDAEQESDEQQEEGAEDGHHHHGGHPHRYGRHPHHHGRHGGWMGGPPHGWGAGHRGRRHPPADQPKKKDDQ